MNGWRRVVLPLLAVTVLSVGCGGLPAADRPSRLPSDGTDSVSPATAPASVSPAPPSTTSAPSTPPASEAEQVQAAVRHYFDVANQATRTGNTATLASLSVPECGCRQLVRFIDGEYRKGHIEGSLTTVVAIDDLELHTRLAALTVTFRVGAGKTVDQAGHVVTPGKAGTATNRMILVQRTDGVWLVSEDLRLRTEFE